MPKSAKLELLGRSAPRTVDQLLRLTAPRRLPLANEPALSVFQDMSSKEKGRSRGQGRQIGSASLPKVLDERAAVSTVGSRGTLTKS